MEEGTAPPRLVADTAKGGAVYTQFNQPIAAQRHAELLRTAEKERLAARAAARNDSSTPFARTFAFLVAVARTRPGSPRRRPAVAA